MRYFLCLFVFSAHRSRTNSTWKPLGREESVFSALPSHVAISSGPPSPRHSPSLMIKTAGTTMVECAQTNSQSYSSTS
ncbi:hypothetical protein KC19_VG157700 [Ceratodon purpureus]|uniref:Uncharacterized protein n=1 Tax=Ceratodon purpureus TaxID=3225 RepID=A0A8T0HQK9_CERPU|nr:hypothetical protein KC19_VG157700 [Ceratodon purpureus]